ncbi:MAG: hypothetical protein WCY08_09880 [Rhodocyclaceae bacterium]
MTKQRLWLGHALAALMLLVLGAGCSSLPRAEGGEDALMKRAEAYWAARVANDLVTAYEFEAVSTRPEGSLQRYISGRGGVAIERGEVLSAKVLDDGRGEVTVMLGYRLPMPGMRKPVEGAAKSYWQLIDGRWYHEPRSGGAMSR